MTNPTHPIYGDSFIPGWPASLPVPYGGPYRAKVVEVHDGDSVLLEISLGFGVRIEAWIRIYGINSPELSKPAGMAARDFLTDRLPVGTPVRVTTLLSTVGEQKQSFTRYVGSIEAAHNSIVPWDVSVEMVVNGHAVWCDRDLRPLPDRPPPIRR